MHAHTDTHTDTDTHRHTHAHTHKHTHTPLSHLTEYQSVTYKTFQQQLETRQLINRRCIQTHTLPSPCSNGNFTVQYRLGSQPHVISVASESEAK